MLCLALALPFTAKPYRSVTLDPSVAVEPLSESMENAGNPLADDTPPPLPSDDRPKVRGLTMPLPLPTVASDGYAVAKELFAAKSHSPSPGKATLLWLLPSLLVTLLADMLVE